MSRRFPPFAAAVMAAWAIAIPVAAAQPHAHGPEAAPTTLTLDHGKKWPTDAALRRGMAAIRDAVHKAPAPLHQAKASPKDYAQLGTRIEAEVGRIVADCKLPPAADAQLHIVIAEVVAGADTMKAAKDAADGRRGLLKVDGALKNYGKYFDDPGVGR
jgi:hypothetical protein